MFFVCLLITSFAFAISPLEEVERFNRMTSHGQFRSHCYECGLQDEGLVINGLETEDFPATQELTKHLATPNSFGGPQSVQLSTCTATLVKTRFILTAAHCVYPQLNESMFRFSGKPLAIKQIHVQPDYIAARNKESQVSQHSVDLALIELAAPIQGTTAELDFDVPKVGQEVAMVGYGLNRSQYELRDGKVELVKSGGGVKRVGYNTIDSLKDDTLTVGGKTRNSNFLGWEKLFFGTYSLVDGTDASVASGDSGGPLYRGKKIIAVTAASTSVVGLANAAGEYENYFAPLSSERNKKFLLSRLNP